MTSKAHAATSTRPSDQRRTARDLVNYPTRFSTQAAGGAMRVINISPFGLMARTDRTLLAGEELVIDLPHLAHITAEVRWIGEGRVGVEFSAAVDEDDYAALLAALPRREAAWSQGAR